ncbi:GumC family protein [Sphingomonas faeni]|uniref:GumC family protein n=1 Tax=Sphingomonas faeni TaxID=185950 RepID=UPI0033508B74
MIDSESIPAGPSTRRLGPVRRTMLDTAEHGLVPFGRPASQQRDRSLPQIDIDDLIRVLLKWKWLILAAVLVGAAAAIAVTMLSPRLYRATTTIEINTTPVEIMGNTRSVQPKMRSEDQFLQTQYGLLKSRSLADRVQKTLALGDDGGFVGKGRQPARRDLSATIKLAGNLDVLPVRGSNLVTLAYTDADAARATRIVNAFATGFIASTAEQRYGATAYARQFLETRLNATRQRLETSERQLVNYAQHQGIVELDGGGGGRGGGGRGNGGNDDGPTGSSGDSLSTQSLTALNGALSLAIGERIAAEQRYRQGSANRASPDVLQNPTIQALRAERAKLAADYRERSSTFKPDYPEMVALRGRIAEIDVSMARESGDVSSSLRSAYLAAVGRETELRSQVAALRVNVLDLRGRGIGYTILQREVETNRTLYDALLQRYKEIGVAGGLGESQATIIDPALPPSRPFAPRPIRNLIAGLVAGLAIGLGIAFGIEFVDDTIKSAEDASNKLKLPILGVIPRMPKARSMIEELATPRSDVAEAYYSVMTALQFTTANGYPKSLLITSSRSGEGKSSTSLALAQNFARVGATVLLIDGDLRKPSFKAGGRRDIGLSKLLVSGDPIAGHVVATNTQGLSLLPSGPVPPNPAELLATMRIHAIVEEAMRQFEVVVVDAPPVLGLADAPVFGSICEATLMVVESGSVRRTIVLSALDRLFGAHARVAGAILTKYNPKTAGYGYGYGQPYGEDSANAPMLNITS